MKQRPIIIVAAAVLLGALLWVPISRFLGWRHDYAEAEPLQKLVWPMADEMKRFNDERGRPPASIEEISRFSKTYDFSRLGDYRHEFTAGGDRLFYLRANRRFSFQIDKSFTPGWADFTGMLDKPRDSAVAE